MAPPAKSFDRADRVVEATGVREEIVELGALVVGRITTPRGWRWSIHAQPLVGTKRCQARHIGTVVAGRAGFELPDGTVLALDPGAVFDVPPGHDGWNAGDEDLVTIEWGGLRDWLLPRQGGRILVALLFTDIVDSTGHARELGDRAWRSLLSAHDEVIRAVVADSVGREIGTTGDGFLVVFDTPLGAVDAARRARDAVRALGLELRQGIHVGEVEAVGQDVRGVAVHQAARVMAAAAAGDILVSSVTRSLLAGQGIAFESRGRQALKGIPGHHELFALV